MPVEDLERFNYSEDELFNDAYNEEFVELNEISRQNEQEIFITLQIKIYIVKINLQCLLPELCNIFIIDFLIKLKQENFNVFNKKITCF